MLTRLFSLTCLLLMTGAVALAQRNAIPYSSVPQLIVATVNKEYADPKTISRCTLDEAGLYRIFVDSQGKLTEIILIDPAGKWLKKTSFVEMTESDITLIMKVQDLVGSVENIKHWTKASFPDGVVEYRITFPNEIIYAWDAHLNYLGQVLDGSLPAKGTNLKKTKA